MKTKPSDKPNSDCTSEGFRLTLSERSLTAFLKALILLAFVVAQWQSANSRVDLPNPALPNQEPPSKSL